jgi:hypothetical protein
MDRNKAPRYLIYIMKQNYSTKWREDANGRIEIEVPLGSKKIWRRIPDKIINEGQEWDADGVPRNVELPPVPSRRPAGFGKRTTSKAPRKM